MPVDLDTLGNDHQTTAAPLYRLPGGRFAVERRRDLPRLSASAAWMLGPEARRAIRSSRAGMGPDAESRWARSAAARLDLNLSVGGLHHIQPGRPYIVAPLHEGFADALALLHLPIPLRFVARSELSKWKVLGSALEAGGHLRVTPEIGATAYRSLLRAAPAILDTGQSLVVFPQGTILGVELAFSRGAFRLAAATGRQLLPVVLTGSHRVWEHPFSPIVRFGQVIRMEVLEPIEPGDAAASLRAVEREMKSIALASDPSPRRFEPQRDGWWDGYRYEIDPDYPELARRIANRRQMRDTTAP